MALAAWSVSAPEAWTWAGIYVLLAVVAPLLYLSWLVRRGVVTDFDVQVREQRVVPLAITLVCGQLAVLLLLFGDAPSILTTVAVALWFQTAVLFGVTLRWKISVHTATAAAVAILAWSAGGTPLPLLIGVPLVSWSRVRLGRHTVAQTVAGALLGCAVMSVALILMR
jgi:membrane-associated phospholipid phosphatase